ncbi:MAG: BCSC C-terminal domain-containing protein [Curvibacter sp.]|nr:BCSC C-terminal domain-containing protein [Curvibacter sp.]
MGLMAALSVPAVHAQQPAIKALVEQGRYWQGKGNFERAAEAWQKLLRVNPNQAEALGGMAIAEANAKHLDEAARYLAQLKSSNPNHPSIPEVEQAVNTIRNAPQLQNARELAKAGKPAEALSTYQSALGRQAPRGPLALEYYQTLGGTAQGWEAARKGLEQLAQESPDDPHIALALAQHLTYRDATRREGIAQLSRLAGNPDVGSAAVESWRKALAWIGSRSADIPLYQAFLRAYPGDAGVQARLSEVEREQSQLRATAAASNDPLRKRTQEAFKALDDGDLEAAEAGFRSVLEARPNDGDALGGFGVLRLRQENFGQARDYLERASRLGQAGRWKSALDSATYWTLVAQATSARESGNLDSARQMLQQAVRLDPRETTAENDLADVLVESGQYDAAETLYRRVLARQADNPDAVRGLVGVLAQNNKADEALRIVEQLSPSQQEKVGALGRLRATQALGQAKAAAARGDDTGARVALENALLNDPANAWVRLDLARLYIKLGATAEARGIMDGLLISNPNMPEALYAHALLSAETADWAGAQATLERVPSANRTRDIAALYKRVWVHVQANTASALASQGRRQEALNLLAQAEPFAGTDPELLGSLALAYTDAGDSNRAMATIRQLLARSARPEPGLRLQYAAILLKTRQDVELAGILRQLQGMPMTAQQRQSFEDLRVAYVVRQADALRDAGDLAAAYDTLSPVLADHPNDPLVIGALARMYAANNDYAQGITLYNRLLEKDPNNLQLLLPAASLAISAKEFPYAESALQIALVRAPQDPEVLTAAGRLYRAEGKTSKATEYFAAAVAAENQLRASQLAAGGQAAAVQNQNPFAARSGQSGLQRQPFTPLSASPMPSMVPVGTLSAYPASVPSRPLPAALGLPMQPVVQTPTAAQTFIPDPASAGRAAQGLPVYAQPAPVAAAPALPTPATYQQVGYQPAPLQSATAAPAPAAKAVTAPSRSTSTNSLGSTRSLAVDSSAAPAPAAVPASALMSPVQASQAAQAVQMAQAAPAGYAQASPTPYVPATGIPAPAYNSSAPPLPAASGWSVAPAPAAAAPLPNGMPAPQARTARDDLRELQQDRIPVATLGLVTRFRAGTSGTSQLSDIETPLQLRFDAGDAKVSLQITPTALNAGTPGSDFGSLSTFGAGPVTSLNQPTLLPGSQSATGAGLGVAYESGRLKVDVGTTPIGFQNVDITGGLRYSVPVGDQAAVGINLSRRPVTDSLLSFAGATDTRTGLKWGGVSATGGRVDLSWDADDFGAYTYGAAYALTGNNVASNSKIEAGGGLYWRVNQTPNSGLTTGLNLTAMGYNKNLGNFTYGQGGYFSPQSYLLMSVPIDWASRSNRISYEVKGSIGLQHFSESSSPYFPTNSTLQSAAVAAANSAFAFGLAGSNSNGAIYPSQTKTGLGYNLGVALEYQIHPQVFFGGHLAIDNAQDYRQFTGGIYVRYALEPYSGLQALPLNAIHSPYDQCRQAPGCGIRE